MVPKLTEESFIAVAKPKWTNLGLPNISANAHHTGQIGLQAICIKYLSKIVMYKPLTHYQPNI